MSKLAILAEKKNISEEKAICHEITGGKKKFREGLTNDQ